MKPSFKIGSFLLAVVMICSTLFVAGCTPLSLNKEWSYKTSDNELPIGVYIYSLDLAYNQAKSYAEKLDGYDSSKDSWLEMEITDDDGKKAVASTWIKDEAKKMCLTYLALDEQIKNEKVEVSDATMASADETAKTYWNVGPYAQYGIMPMKTDLEKYGISFDSFAYSTMEFDTKKQALFTHIYGKGGTKEVTEDEQIKFVNDKYTSYKYFTVNLFESVSDDTTGSTTNKAYDEKKLKKVTDEIDGYAKDINNGTSYDNVLDKYKKANKITNGDPSTSGIENLESNSSSVGDDVKKALNKLGNNKATTIKVGEGDSAVYYLVYKEDIKKASKDYLSTEANSSSVVNSMKNDEYNKYLDELAGKLKAEENSSVINKYDPKMFFVKVEPTTAATTSSSEE